jgi:hypothetical protein
MPTPGGTTAVAEIYPLTGRLPLFHATPQTFKRNCCQPVAKFLRGDISVAQLSITRDLDDLSKRLTFDER